MPILEVLVGLPGSGKSTHVSKKDFHAFVYSTDAYIEKFAAASGQTYGDVFRDVIDDATKHMNAQLELAISVGHDVVWDQTNMTSKKRRGILSRFPKSYKKICYCIHPPSGCS